MARIIVSATLIVLLAVLVAFNIRYTTSVSIYGTELTGVPVLVVALLSFALGVVYSLFLYIGRYLGRARRKGAEDRHRQIARREAEVSEKESVLAEGARSAQEAPTADHPQREGAGAPSPGTK